MTITYMYCVSLTFRSFTRLGKCQHVSRVSVLELFHGGIVRDEVELRAKQVPVEGGGGGDVVIM